MAACFADLGHDVVNIDVDGDIVTTINSGEPLIHKDGSLTRSVRTLGRW